MNKLKKHQEKETDVLSKRIMPKTDFLKVIEHDKLYYNTLEKALEFNIIKQDILGKKCEKVLANQTREGITQNINNLVDWAETQVKVLDLKAKLTIQRKLIDDKETHFDNVFMPQFTKEKEEAVKNLESTIKEAKEKLKSKRKELSDILDKIKYELRWWEKASAKDKKNDEYKIEIYKPLKRLISAFDKKESELKQLERYKV